MRCPCSIQGISLYKRYKNTSFLDFSCPITRRMLAWIENWLACRARLFFIHEWQLISICIARNLSAKYLDTVCGLSSKSPASVYPLRCSGNWSWQQSRLAPMAVMNSFWHIRLSKPFFNNGKYLFTVVRSSMSKKVREIKHDWYLG